MPEFLQRLMTEQPILREALCALAVVIVDLCALFMMLMMRRENKVTNQIWEQVSDSMELVEGKCAHPLLAEEVLIGRHAAADIRVADPAASRYHALLTVSDGVWRITDLASACGTFVNGKRIKSVRLHENDKITIGDTFLYLRKGNVSHV